jgi:hypothetical protein
MFERQLQQVLDRLSARDPGPEHCGRGCICEADLDLAPGQAPAGSPPWGCSLDSDALASRTGQWRALAAAAISVERGSGTARLMLPADPEMIAAVAALCAAETACCPPLSSGIRIRSPCGFRPGGIVAPGAQVPLPAAVRGRGTCGLRGHAAPIRAKP